MIKSKKDQDVLSKSVWKQTFDPEYVVEYF